MSFDWSISMEGIALVVSLVGSSIALVFRIGSKDQKIRQLELSLMEYSAAVKKVEQELSENKEWVHKGFASKIELDKLDLRLDKNMSDINTQLAVIRTSIADMPLKIVDALRK